MKLLSYHHCCADLRTARREGVVRPGERGCPGAHACALCTVHVNVLCSALPCSALLCSAELS